MSPEPAGTKHPDAGVWWRVATSTPCGTGRIGGAARRRAARVAFCVAAAIAPFSGAVASGADFGTVQPSSDVRLVADWVARSGDNMGTDFLLIDKKQATLYIFDARARLRGATAVLLGAALGDDSVPGIGDRPLSQVKPQERTTPAGRFLAERGRDLLSGDDVVWIDYDAAVSIHRVVTSNPAERRLQRLASPAVVDNRISWGCVNVAKDFYETYVRPIFSQRRAMVYVLPDVKDIRQIFPVSKPLRGQSASTRKAGSA